MLEDRRMHGDDTGSCSARLPWDAPDSPMGSRTGRGAGVPTGIGARIRYPLDRDSEHYKPIYRQRTAVERINSQAVAPGIERPHLRRGQSFDWPRSCQEPAGINAGSRLIRIETVFAQSQFPDLLIRIG